MIFNLSPSDNVLFITTVLDFAGFHAVKKPLEVDYMWLVFDKSLSVLIFLAFMEVCSIKDNQVRGFTAKVDKMIRLIEIIEELTL